MDLQELEARLRANPELAKKLYFIGKKYNLDKYHDNKRKLNKKGKGKIINEQEKVLRG